MSPRRPRVLLLCGGRSGEHEVSLASAASVLGASEGRLDVVPRVIAEDGRLLDEDASRNALRTGRSDGVDARHADADVVRGLAALPEGAFDVVFPLLHGPNGEDGTVQGLLEIYGLPYVGADVLAAATAMDKVTMKRVFAAVGLPQVPWHEVTAERWSSEPGSVPSAIHDLPWPRFVKPAALGSSVGIARVDRPEDLARALDEAFRHGDRAIVEAGVTGGREIEVGVLGGASPDASPPGEIRVLDESFYDYEHKYTEGGAELVIPAPLDEAVTERLRDLAVRAFEVVHAFGLARVDFFVTPGGEVLVNEINTMPGFTEHSMYPKLWQAGGVAYPELIERLVELARERHARSGGRATARPGVSSSPTGGGGGRR